MGTFFGPVVGPAITVALMAAMGWHAVFIIFGLVGIVLAWVWHKYAHDNPAHSPTSTKPNTLISPRPRRCQ